jgi:prepilin-type N-terminal cleavage/methylation domain-containing protein
MSKNRKGFTLVEIIIVIAIIAVLAAAIFVAVDPARRIQESNNARRWSDVTTMLDAVIKNQADNEGTLHAEVSAITADEFVIIGTTDDDDGLCASETTADAACSNVATATGTADCVDLSELGSKYLAAVPTDPKNGSDADTSYFITRDANNAVTIGSCDEEGEGSGGTEEDAPVIELTR